MPILGILASAITGNLVTNSYESIATTTVTSNVASITFSSIPATYTHLQLRIFTFIDTSNPTLIMNVNGDTGSNYTFHRILGFNGSASSAGSSSARTSYALGFCGAPSYASTGIIDFVDYANTNKYKTARSLIGSNANGNFPGSTQEGYVSLWSGVWMNTSAISSIVIAPEGGGVNFTQYSSFALYGIKS